jgi:hypothetical protein
VVVKRVNVNSDVIDSIQRTHIFDDVAIFPALRHPNLVTCLGVAFSPFPEIVFTRVDGTSLHALLHGSNVPYLSLRTKYRIARGMCDGLAFLNIQAVEHGRFSSRHVLLGADMEPRICGFAMEKTMSAVRKGAAGEWIRWASPERVAVQMGEIADCSKTDVYSFGMVCWELCSEIEPFGDIRSDEELWSKIRGGDRPFSDEDFEILIPGLFAPLILGSLATDPHLRPLFSSCQNYLKVFLFFFCSENFFSNNNPDHLAAASTIAGAFGGKLSPGVSSRSGSAACGLGPGGANRAELWFTRERFKGPVGLDCAPASPACGVSRSGIWRAHLGAYFGGFGLREAGEKRRLCIGNV